MTRFPDIYVSCDARKCGSLVWTLAPWLVTTATSNLRRGGKGRGAVSAGGIRTDAAAVVEAVLRSVPGVSREVLFSPDRCARTVEARGAIAWILRMICGLPLRDIGAALDRDRTAARHLIGRVRVRLDRDEFLGDQIEDDELQGLEIFSCRWSLSGFDRDEQSRMKLALADMMDRGYIAVYDVAVLPDGTEIEL